MFDESNVVPINIKEQIGNLCCSIMNNMVIFNKHCDKKDKINMIPIFKKYESVAEVFNDAGTKTLHLDSLKLKDLKRFGKEVMEEYLKAIEKIKNGKYKHFSLDLNNNIYYDDPNVLYEDVYI